jgi:hypothetical protein
MKVRWQVIIIVMTLTQQKEIRLWIREADDE